MTSDSTEEQATVVYHSSAPQMVEDLDAAPLAFPGNKDALWVA